MKIPISILGDIYLFDIEKTVYCSACENTMICYMENQSIIEIPTSIDFLEKRLAPCGFFRTNIMHLVNMNYISKINGMNSQRIPIAIRTEPKITLQSIGV